MPFVFFFLPSNRSAGLLLDWPASIHIVYGVHAGLTSKQLCDFTKSTNTSIIFETATYDGLSSSYWDVFFELLERHFEAVVTACLKLGTRSGCNGLFRAVATPFCAVAMLFQSCCAGLFRAVLGRLLELLWVAIRRAKKKPQKNRSMAVK